MDPPDHWAELDLADRLRLAALQLELTRAPARLAEAVHAAADLLALIGERLAPPDEDASAPGPKRPDPYG